MAWQEMRWDLESVRRKWRLKFARLMDVSPEMVDDWTLDHLMREINSSRRMILERSFKP